jgi:phosphate-selective porin OprO and OprP
MKSRILSAVAATALLFCHNASAKSLEDVLKEKGVLTEQEYKSVDHVKPYEYKPGKGFTMTSPDQKFQLSLGGRLQTRYTYTDMDVNTATATDNSKWEVRRMKVWLNGYAYTKDLTYLLQVELTQGGSSRLLEHAYFNYRLIDEVQLLAGQTKVPFGRQWLNSSGAQQFVDRSTASDMFRPGYDTGVKLNGDLLGGLTTYEFGVYGGVGQSTTRAANANDNAIAARVTVNPFGKMAYSESDLDDLKKPLLSVGGNYFGDKLKATYRPATTGVPAATTLETNNLNFAGSNGWLGKGLGTFTGTEKLAIDMYGADLAFKWHGFSAQAEYFSGEAEGDSSDRKLRAQGYYAQAGYCVIPKTLELAVRYSWVDPNMGKTDDQQTDYQGAVSYYFHKHNLKVQGDITDTHDQARGKVDDMIYRVQAQVIF